MKNLLKLYIMLLLLIPIQATAFECNVCHSKNPAMVKMHDKLKGQSCFGCHKPGARLMGKGQPKDKENQLKRRQTEEICLPCHTQTASSPQPTQ